MASFGLDLVVEMWETAKSVIPAKERLGAAEAFIKIFDEYGFSKEDYEELCDGDKIMQTAYDRYFDDEDEEDEDDWD